jgi:putative membrane protein
MTFQATLLAAALALVPAFARADEAKKTDTRSQSNPAMDTRNTTNTADQSDHAQPPSQAGKMDRTAMDHESMEHKKLTDDQVIRKLHHVNQEEIKAGQLAQQKGSTQDVKDYGATLVRDHTKGDQNLKALASKMNVDLEAMKHDQRHQEKQQVHENKMEQLQKMSGKDFDRGFAQMMVNGHRQAIEMVKDARGDAKPELKAMLDQLLPTLQRHEDMANDILNKAGNTASSR